MAQRRFATDCHKVQYTGPRTATMLPLASGTIAEEPLAEHCTDRRPARDRFAPRGDHYLITNLPTLGDTGQNEVEPKAVGFTPKSGQGDTSQHSAETHVQTPPFRMPIKLLIGFFVPQRLERIVGTPR
jgi:hypothetical protein